MKTLKKIVRSETAPADTDVLWLNTTDGVLYAFDGREGWKGTSEDIPEGLAQESTSQEILGKVNTLTALDSDIASGKSHIAAAISQKGVSTSAEDSLADMATKISQIPQEVNTGVSDFEQMIAPSPYIWNVYSVAQDIMNDAETDYLPSYLATYKQTYGANSFFVGEYYLGYTTLPLTGADGYLTCDGDFYTIAGEEGSRVVTHTLPDGTVETYSAEEIIHTWHDSESSRCNRWVAFFYLASAYSFTNVTSSICPRRVALCGECLSFIISGENRLTDVWVIGTLGNLEGGTTGATWNPAQVIRNYRSHSGGAIYYAPTNVVSIIMTDLEDVSNWIIDSSATNLQIISMPATVHSLPPIIKGTYPALKRLFINGDNIEVPNASNWWLPSVTGAACGEIYIKGLKYLGLNLGSQIGGLMRYPSSNIYLPDLEKIRNESGTYTGNGVAIYNDAGGGSANEITTVYLPKLRSTTNLSDTNTYFILMRSNTPLPSLRDVWLGEMAQSMDFTKWTATNVTTTPEGISEINANIRNHIAARIADMTGETSPTITFGANLYNNLEQATLDAFTAKNWTVASA